MRVIDSHVHLASLDNVDEVIKRANAVEVYAIVAVGGDIDSSKVSVIFAEEYSHYVYPGIGVHPSEVLKVDHDIACSFISENAEKAVTIGEIGLDYAYDFSGSKDVRKRQRALYGRLLAIAEEHGKPVSIHSRSAYRDSLKLLRMYDLPGAVFHWFDGPLNVLSEIIDCGYYVSATPAIEYSKGHRAVLAKAPLERILVETDSPVYLRRYGRVSEPADVLITIKELAALKGSSTDEVSKVSARNTETLFRLVS